MQRRGFLGVSLAWLLACRRGPTEVAGGRKFYSSGPYVGVRDGTDPNPNYASSMINMVIRSVREGLRARPGVVALVDFGEIGIQGAISFRTSAGVAYTFVAINGHIYRVANGTNAATNVTPSGGGAPTISSSARIYMAVLADKLFVSDGINPMWYVTTLTGTPLVGTTLDIDATGTSQVFGQPVVYYAKLFVINGKQRNQILWSEENDGTIGYNGLGSPTYLDVWTLAQNDTDPLYALLGDNDSLYYWRENSMGQILGRVTPDFTTTGVHDAISSSIGTISPGTVCLAGTVIFFLDQNGLPQVYRIGQGLVDPPLWQDCINSLQFFGQIDPSLLTLYAHAAYNTDLDRVVLVHPVNTSSAPRVFTFDAMHSRFHGSWQAAVSGGPLGTVRSIFMRQDVSDGSPGDAMCFVSQPGNSTHAYLGRLYRWGESTWSDQETVGGSAVFSFAGAYGPALGSNDTEEKYFDEMNAIYKAPSAVALTHSTFYKTSRTGAGSGQDVTKTPSTIGDDEITVGLNAFGRWIQPGYFRTSTAANPVQLIRMGVYGQYEDASPTRP